MNVFIETAPALSQQTKVVFKSLMQVVLGSFLLVLSAKISVPIQPVPMTLQTLGLFLLTMMMGRRNATLATLLYLAQATVGLPVLSNGLADPLWMIGPKAGYLFAFPIAAFLTGTMIHKKQESSLWVVFSIFCAQLVIYSFGGIFLARFIGFKMGIILGVLPFLLLDGCKILMASTMSGLYLRLKKHFS